MTSDTLNSVRDSGQQVLDSVEKARESSEVFATFDLSLALICGVSILVLLIISWWVIGIIMRLHGKAGIKLAQKHESIAEEVLHEDITASEPEISAKPKLNPKQFDIGPRKKSS